uniref:Anthocyanidin 3-O-glucosyltransferase n=1 Tax=Salix viminalis TaxID=40686 RepID=A0A6N2LDX5_SALVM
MKKAQVVLVPSPGIGHLVPAIEFAKRLLDQDDSFLITVLVIIKAPFGPHPDTCNQSMLITTIDTRIQYITLPKVTPPDLDPLRSPENYFTTFMEAHKPLVRDAVVNQVMSIKPAVPVVGLVVDLFCASMIDVANELGISSYVYFASSAAFLGLLLYLPTRQEQAGIEFKETDPDLIVSCFANPVPARVMPSVLLNKDGGYTCFENLGRRFREAKGIVVNSFAELESHAVRSFSGGGAPPVYTVGPLVNINGHSLMGSNLDRHSKILEWLDDQREKSVVFLCFGSIGRFREAQVKEIALGLEQSGHRFLWSIRKPPLEGHFALPSDYNNFEEVLPDGFLERTKNIGMSLWHGVPVVTWPMHAEQQINAFQMVKDLELAVEMTLDYRMRSNNLVMADKIAKSVECVMEEDREVRNRVKAMSEASRKAVMEGGSSFSAIGDLIKDMLS